jgi:hypothetical protein
MTKHSSEPSVEAPFDDDRRKFLAACGKFAVVTPPAVTVLLSTSLNSKAIAHSGGREDHNPGDHNPGYGSKPGGNDLLDWLEKLLEKVF